MKNHKFVDGDCFTLKLLCPELQNFFEEEQNLLEPYLERQFTSEGIHIGFKYLGYEKDYSNEYMLNLIPLVSEIIEKYLPLEIKITGLGAFWSTPEWPSKNILFLKVALSPAIQSFHNELGSVLKNKCDAFELAEGPNYTPHISLGIGNISDKFALKQILARSKFSEKCINTKFVMRLKNNIHKIILDK